MRRVVIVFGIAFGIVGGAWLAGGCASRELMFGAGVDLAAGDLGAVDLRGADLAGADLVAPDLASPPGAIGDGCQLPTMPESEGPQRGTCAEGLICFGSHLNAPGGYCSKLCSVETDCPSTTTCPMFSGSICLKRCESASDCRQGYICDAGFGTVKACTMPDQPSP